MKEFDLIKSLIRPLSGAGAFNLADDCAGFGEYIITKDILSSGVHFFPDDPPYNLARKALRVNLSDIAASGGEAFGFMLALALPRGTSKKWLEEFFSGLKQDIASFNLQLLGGDTIFHDAALLISVTAIGRAKKQILRSGAKPGDNIFVSGETGKGYLGLKSRLAGRNDKFSAHYDLPQPRFDISRKINNIATSCIDVSDGLLADLGHICVESQVGAEIFSGQIPLAGEGNLLELLSGGDDYELLFTAREESVEGCSKIGRIIPGEGIVLDGDPIAPKGFEHG